MVASKKTAPADTGKKARVIEILNKARSMELHAIMQYMNQHYALADLDYGELAGKIKKIAVDEMRHAEDFAERIKDMGGEPTAQLDGAVQKRQDVKDIFPFDSKLEDATIEQYNEFIKICRENDDQVSANIFERIIDEEQGHFNDFDDIAAHIRELGASYLAKVSGGNPD